MLTHKILFLVCKNHEEAKEGYNINKNAMTEKTTKIILLAMLLSFGLNTIAQVAINNDGSPPDGSAMLDVKSTTGGILLPRLTNVQRDAIIYPVAGLFIFNIDESSIQFYNGSTWKAMGNFSCIPQQPTNITGNNYPDCNQSGLTYSIAEIAWASSYNWTIPTDATITGGQGTTDITVDMGTQNGNVSVRAESGCGNSAYKDLPITIGIPAQPGSITGNAYPECNATAIIYSIDAVNGALNYTWTVPSDATIASGQGTTNITVNFVTNSGNISVRAENSCGNSNYSDLAISIGVPVQPGSITGNILPEPNATGVTYSIDAANGATSYNWTVPTDATIASGQGTTNITVDFGITSGSVSVRSENTCGHSNYSDLTITFFTCNDQYTDSRNSQAYNTISIGSQCWFAENLNIGTRIDKVNPQTDNAIIEKYCFRDNDANCTIYGGLYQWDEMMQYITTEGVKGICPDGWHLPSDGEWIVLTDYLGGTDIAGGKMKEAGTTHWYSPNTEATNESGFTGLPGGQLQGDTDNNYYQLTRWGAFWSSSEISSTNVNARYLKYNYKSVTIYSVPKERSISIRCLKN